MASTDAADVFDGVLDLTGADESAGTFDAIPAGTYAAHIRVAPEWRFTSNPDGSKKLPDNTPYLAVQFQIDDEEARDGSKVINRVIFGNFFNPSDGDKLSYHRGVMLNFLKCVGYTPDDMMKKGFKPDLDSMAGQEVTIVVTRSKDKLTNEWVNNLNGVKLAGETTTAGSLI